ncbi:hypothetical protein [Photobacterium damselae]|uniref:hypothetical protein n=1 Tax=Photobacterium damselae TaxID=38293 RepID=UPI004068D8CF
MSDCTHYIEVPFEYRHCCWFCGEPFYEHVSFMATPNYDGQKHPIMLPSCHECFGLAKDLKVSSLDLLRDKIKEKLHQKYQKHLRIGLNWTEDELRDCEFEGKALEGFRESAWMMYQIAKERVNYSGWDLVIDGIPLPKLTTVYQVEFDGVIYTSLHHAVTQLAQAYAIPEAWLADVVELVGRDKLSYALRFCKTTYGYSAQERQASLDSLKMLLAEEAANQHSYNADEKNQVVHVIKLNVLKELMLYRTLIPTIPIKWALERGITTLSELASNEELFFSYFNQDSELTAFTYFNALQIYFEKREEDPLWAQQDDPNREVFLQIQGLC